MQISRLEIRIPFRSIAIAKAWEGLYTNGYVELYHVYQLGQELMGAEKGVVLLLEVLLHLKSGNR